MHGRSLDSRSPMLNSQFGLTCLAAIVVLASACLTASCQSAEQTIAGPTSPDPAAMLRSSYLSNNLESDTTPPFHLSAHFQTFDYLGKASGNGTLAVFWDGHSRFKRVVSYRGVTQTIIKTEKGVSADNDGPSSYELSLMIPGFMYPLPRPAMISGSVVEYRAVKLPSIALDCAILTPKVLAYPPSHVEQRVFCLDNATHTLRLTQMSMHMALTYNDLMTFHGKYVPRKVKLTQGSVERGELTVDDISDWKADSSLFVVAPGDHEPSPSLGPVRPTKIAPFIYPMQLAALRMEAKVVLYATVSADGKVSDLEVISAPNPAFADAAVDSVRKWKYSPYVVNGKPTATHTFVFANFDPPR